MRVPTANFDVFSTLQTEQTCNMAAELVSAERLSLERSLVKRNIFCFISVLRLLQTSPTTV